MSRLKPPGTPQTCPQGVPCPRDEHRIQGAQKPLETSLWSGSSAISLGGCRVGPHLVLLLQAPQGAQDLADVILGVHQGQLLLYPGHLLFSISAELPEQALGLQCCPALPQGLLQALEPAAAEVRRGEQARPSA